MRHREPRTKKLLRLADLERGLVAELRHDFRRYYGCSYDDVPEDEAVDLIEMLPDGSRYVAARYPLRVWGDERNMNADILDAIKELTWFFFYDRAKAPSPPRVIRPRDAAKIAAESRRAAKSRKIIESDGWEEM